MEKESSLTHVVHLFLESCLDDHPPPFQFSLSPKLLRARELIHSDFERKITLDELAAAAGLSRYHFLRSFRQAFGTPPHAYQNHLRVAKAKSLLARGASLHDATVGFADQSHLIRHFKRATLQLTPSRYAEALTPRR